MYYNPDLLKSDEIRLVLDKKTEADPSKGWVLQYFFKIQRSDGTIVGVCSLRAGHNEATHCVGNIGYGVYEEFRGSHYAGKACRLLLELAKKHGMGYVIITCSPNNSPSRKTCEYAGGQLEDIFSLPQNMRWNGETQKCRYRILL